MDGNGIMQDVRELLSQGLTVPEIIAKGYAPSTVYRVQRDNRRKLGFSSNSRHGNGGSTRSLDYWGQLEAENQRLNQRIESLEMRLAEVDRKADASPMAGQVTEMQQMLDEVVTNQEQMLRELAVVKARVGKVDEELDDLAVVFRDELLLGVGEPRWRRR